MPILQVENVSKRFAIGDRRIDVLRDVSFAVDPGEFVVIQGASGSGKTTLLTLMSGLDHPSTGRIHFDGLDITTLKEDRLAPLRNRAIGFVFQSFHLVPALSALENVMFPAQIQHRKDAPQRARALLETVGMMPRCHNLPHQLSGGEKQRVAICRALVNRPKVIFADEPTGNLDSANSRAIMDLLLDFHRQEGSTLVLVTHSPEIAALAQRTIGLHDGRIQEPMPDAA